MRSNGDGRSRQAFYSGVLGLLLVAIYAAVAVFLLVTIRQWNGAVKLKLVLAHVLLLIPGLVLMALSKARTPQPLRLPRSAAWISAYCLITVVLGLLASHFIYMSDEGAYLFQARCLLSGSLSAPAPGFSSDPGGSAATDFQHLIISSGRWFGKYPPGWPLVLAAGLAVHLDWLVNPLLGLLILLLTARITRSLFADRTTTALSVAILVLSPMFLLNCVGYLSHALCGVLIAASVLFCLKADDPEQDRLAWLAAPLIGLAALVRPFTAACIALPLVAYTIFCIWRRPRAWFGFAFAWGLSGLATLGATLIMNLRLTGSALVSPYALYRKRSFPLEISLSPLALYRNATKLLPVSVGQALIATCAGIFLLALCAILWERRRRREVLLLAGVFLALVFGYLTNSESSDSSFGERYWFEALFAVAILAGRGMVLLQERWRSLPARRLAATVLAVQVIQYAIYVQILWVAKAPYRAVAEVRKAARPGEVVYMLNDKADTGFHAFAYNLNEPDIEHAPVAYLIDPGPQYRDQLVCRMGRSQWTLVGYDRLQRKAILIPHVQASCPAPGAN